MFTRCYQCLREHISVMRRTRWRYAPLSTSMRQGYTVHVWLVHVCQDWGQDYIWSDNHVSHSLHCGSHQEWAWNVGWDDGDTTSERQNSPKKTTKFKKRGEESRESTILRDGVKRVSPSITRFGRDEGYYPERTDFNMGKIGGVCWWDGR